MSVTPTSDSIVDSNALLYANNGSWGRAINGEAFQADILISHDGYQYTAWYRNDADRSVMIARRTIDGANVGEWEVVDTGSALTRGIFDSNVHNVISIGISKNDGTLHLSWDHHANNLRYRVSVPGLVTNNKDAWGPGMFNAEQGHLSGTTVSVVSYPTFFNAPNGDLHFAYRNGSSGNGEFVLSTYSNGSWSTPTAFTSSGGGSYFGSNTRNAYPNGFDYGPDGKLHTTFVWREASGGANHDISYAYSEDGGITWKNNDGVVIANTAIGDKIAFNDPGVIVQPMDRQQSLYNQQSQFVDGQGNVHALMWHRRQEPGFEWQSGDPTWAPEDSAYFHYFRDADTGEWSSRRLPVEVEIDGELQPLRLGRRGQILADNDGNVFAIYTTRVDSVPTNYVYGEGRLVIAGATAASDYSDWSILYLGDMIFDGEPLVDSSRFLNDGIISIFLQEASPLTTRTGTNLHVLEFSVAVPEPMGLGLVALGGMALLRRRSR